MKVRKFKYVFLIFAIAVFAYLGYQTYGMKNTYVSDIISSALTETDYSAYKSLFSDLITEREGTYAEIIEAIFRNDMIFLGVSSGLYLILIVLGICNVVVPFQGVLSFAVSVLNIDTYFLTRTSPSGPEVIIISAIPILFTLIFWALNKNESKARKRLRKAEKKTTSTVEISL